jgi:hypothetical protein
MPRNRALLYLAMGLFMASTICILIAVERGERIWTVSGAVGNVVADILLLLSLWMPRRNVDWDRVAAEQRLWESGPLGRKWLRVRQRLSNRWKL